MRRRANGNSRGTCGLWNACLCCSISITHSILHPSFYFFVMISLFSGLALPRLMTNNKLNRPRIFPFSRKFWWLRFIQNKVSLFFLFAQLQNLRYSYDYLWPCSLDKVEMHHYIKTHVSIIKRVPVPDYNTTTTMIYLRIAYAQNHAGYHHTHSKSRVVSHYKIYIVTKYPNLGISRI